MLDIVSANGTASTTFTIKAKDVPVKPGDPDVPGTGDNRLIWLWIALSVIALGGLTALAIVQRRRRTN